MTAQNTSTAYGSVAKFFHWIIAILVLGMLIYGFFLEDFPKDIQPITYNIHKVTGLTIFLLMALNIIWRIYNPKPVWPFNMPDWQQIMAKVVHVLLYITVLIMPMLGLIGSVAAGRPPHIGSIIITLPIEKNKALAEASMATHNFVAIVLIILISLHVCGALYHHYIKQDNILRRMLPGRRY